MHPYASAHPPQPQTNVPISRAWDLESEWAQVCVLRAQHDEVLRMATEEQLDPDFAERLIALGPELPCYAIDAGIYLFLDTAAGQQIAKVPTDDNAARVQLFHRLDHSCQRATSVTTLPDEEGLFELIGTNWVQCHSFRNLEPNALVMDSCLLEDPARWMIGEANERVHSLGYDDLAATLVEIVVAELLHDIGRYENTERLLAESKLRLDGLA